jgi:hypothetical protein
LDDKGDSLGVAEEGRGLVHGGRDGRVGHEGNPLVEQVVSATKVVR